MSKLQKLGKKIRSFTYNHIWVKYTMDYGTAFLMSVLSALIFSFGVVCFMKPGLPNTTDFVSGGSSGLAQTIQLIIEVCGVNFGSNRNLVFSIIYVCINVPLVILAFFGVGKRFAIFTLVNVGSVFLFTNILAGEWISTLSKFINNNGGLLARALFAGLCTGLSSAIAYKFETSAGGFDIISYYISIRKSKNVGRYGMIINGIIITSFYLVTGLKGAVVTLNGVDFDSWTIAISGILFSLVYLVETMVIIDLINVRNKKVQLQIITENSDLPRLLLANVPHGATVVKGTGAYSGSERTIIYLIISTSELKSVIHFIQQIDPESFVNVTNLQQVYGKFFIRPVK